MFMPTDFFDMLNRGFPIDPASGKHHSLFLARPGVIGILIHHGESWTVFDVTDEFLQEISSMEEAEFVEYLQKRIRGS